MNNLPKLIGIAGPAGVGKDTAADFIISRAPEYFKLSFADPLKRMLQVGLGLTREQTNGPEKEVIDPRFGCTPRHIMQTLGTEWGRQMIHPDIWVRAMRYRIAAQSVVIPDVRFANEAAFIREHGLLIHIEGRGGIEGNHASEGGLARLDCDMVLLNEGDLDQLYGRLASALSI